MKENSESLIASKAGEIFDTIKKSKSVLLHCHPSPDPDSVCSALAMKLVVQSLGINATVISGDSKIPSEFISFPGANEIVDQNFLETDLSQYDLFLIQDTASLDRISSKGPIIFPPNLRTVNIDHHPTNPGFAEINLIVSDYPATCQILAELFGVWNVKITPEIARNLFIGIYTDTGGFKYRGTTAKTFEIASKLVAIDPTAMSAVSVLYDSNSPTSIALQAYALSSIQKFFDDKLVISSIPYSFIEQNNIPQEEISAGSISSILKTVVGWDIDVAMIENNPGEVKISFRTRNSDKYDVSLLAASFGGGGHKAAAGVMMKMSLNMARDQIINRVKELYNFN